MSKTRVVGFEIPADLFDNQAAGRQRMKQGDLVTVFIIGHRYAFWRAGLLLDRNVCDHNDKIGGAS